MQKVGGVVTACGRPAPGGEPDFALSSETPGGYVWQAALARTRRPRDIRSITNPAETCGSRRLPGTTQRLAALRGDLNESTAAGRCIALGDSREPPVATFFGRMERRNEYRQVVRYAPKRLARRSLLEFQTTGRSLAPLQALGTNMPRQPANCFEDENDMGLALLKRFMDSIEHNSTIITAIQSRRTIKQFRSDPIPEETLWRILDAARWAPNHRLTEPWRIAVIGTQSREALADALASQSASSQDPSALAKAKEDARQKVMSSPVLLAVTCRLAGNPAQQTEDLAAVCAAVQNLQLAAWGEGIGTHWNTGRVTRLPETFALLQLSERDEQLVGFLYLGYPAQIPETPKRRPIKDFVRSLP